MIWVLLTAISYTRYLLFNLYFCKRIHKPPIIWSRLLNKTNLKPCIIKKIHECYFYRHVWWMASLLYIDGHFIRFPNYVFICFIQFNGDCVQMCDIGHRSRKAAACFVWYTTLNKTVTKDYFGKLYDIIIPTFNMRETKTNTTNTKNYLRDILRNPT